MRKRGAISMEMIVYAALALIVLVLLGFIFRQQIGSSAGSLFKIGQEAEEGARGQRCITVMTATSRQCLLKCEEGWHEVYSSVDWLDCQKSENKKCCEKE